MFDAILFDFDGTLVDFVDSDIQCLKWLHEFTNTAVSFDDFLDTAVDEIMKFHTLVDAKKINPLVMHKFRLENTFIRLGLKWDNEYVTLYKNKLVEKCAPFDGVGAVLTMVQSKAKLGLITNAYDAQEQKERIKNSGLENFFDSIVIAGEVGCYKPFASIFLESLNRLGVTPNKALYIGDSVKYDIVGANAVGMKTVLFCQKQSRRCDIADFIVDGVPDLYALLKKL